jgi:N-methylhydantoinase B
MTSSTGVRVDYNVRLLRDGTLECVHCQQKLEGTPSDFLSSLPVHEGPPNEAGPHIFANPAVYIDEEVVFRQYYCPGCFTALRSEVVPR